MLYCHPRRLERHAEAPFFESPTLSTERPGHEWLQATRQQLARTTIRLKDREPEPAAKVILFGYLIGDIITDKQNTVYKNHIARFLFNAVNKKDLDEKVGEKEIESIKKDPEFENVVNDKSQKFKNIPIEGDLRQKVDNYRSKLKEAKLTDTVNAQVQLLKIDDKTKITIMNNVLNNKPFTKEFVEKNKSATKDTISVPKEHLTRVNYPKGFDWFKATAIALGIFNNLVNGKAMSFILNGISGWLNNAANTWGDLAGSKVAGNLGNVK
jgi:hypothetical protein